MRTGSVSASVSLYSNDNTLGGQETVRIPSRLTLSLHINYLLRRLTSADFFLNRYIFIYIPIRSGLFQTVNDPVGGALKAPPPPTISKTILSIFTISYMCILPGVLGMFQLDFFLNSRF